MSKNLVASFNALVQSQTITAQRVPNEWHFDLCFLRRLPTSSFYLIILQPHIKFLHTATLSCSGDTSIHKSTASLDYFPDTPQEAAPEIVKELLHFFVFVNVCFSGNTSDPKTLAPWRLTTRHKNLAQAVSAELKRQGVCPPRVCDVDVASAGVNAIADARLRQPFDALRGKNVTRTFDNDLLPDFVSLFNAASKPFIPRDYKNLQGPARYARMARHYGALLARGAPLDGGPYHGPQSLVKEHHFLGDIQELLMDSPIDVVKSAADIGDADAALDYGIRLSLGLDCEPSRKLSRVYLMRAADSKTASDRTKATAHGLLIFWYYEASIVETVPIHFVYAACHHANMASFYFDRASPPNSPKSPAVAWFLDSVVNFNNDDDIPSDIFMLYPNLFSVDKEIQDELRNLDPQSLQRRLTRPHKYLCAAIDCEIQVDFAGALSECAGRCDKDKKPSYCSWQCQKRDWAIHKPLCRPGARCSSVKKPSAQYAVYGTRRAPTLRLQIYPSDVDAPVLKSYTLTATQLKALKPFSENPARFKFPKGLRGFHETPDLPKNFVPSSHNDTTDKFADAAENIFSQQYCAANGCLVSVLDMGPFPICDGPCNFQTKALYCSEKCQNIDKKARNIRCRAGAPCSVTNPTYAVDALSSPQSITSDESSWGTNSLTSFSFEDNAAIPISTVSHSAQKNGFNNEMAFYPMIGALGLLSFFFSK